MSTITSHPFNEDAGAQRGAGSRPRRAWAGARTGWWSTPVLATVCLGCALRAAGPSEPPVMLPPWVVEETAERQLGLAKEDAFAATLGPTSLVPSSAWSGRAVGTLAEALRQAPGVMMQESFGGFEPPRLSIRGSGLDSAPSARGVALLADGLPLARADGSFHSGLFDPLLFSRVEVYRGTLHMALTPAVLGGVLNAVTAPGGDKEETTLHAAGGSSGQIRARFSARAGGAGVAASLSRSDGWRDHSGQERRALAAGVGRAIGQTSNLGVSVYFAEADYDVPGPLTLADAQARPRSISAAVARDRPRRESDVTRLAAQWRASPAGGAAVSAGLSWLRLRDDFYQLQANGETDATSDDLSAHFTVARPFALAGVSHQWLARATFSTGGNEVARYLNDRSARGARFGAFDARARTAAFSLEDLFPIGPDAGIGLGLTAVHARRALDDRHTTAGTPAALTRAFSISDVSPRAGLRWRLRPGLALRAAISRGIEPPSFDDLIAVQGAYPNLGLRSRELRAQRATTLEIGLAGEAGALGWDVTAFRGSWSDEILRLADAAGLPRGSVNAGPTLHQGLETALRWKHAAGAWKTVVAVTSTLGRFVFDDDPTYGRNRLAGAPPHVGAVEFSCEHARGFFGALENNWVAGRTFVDHGGRLGYGGHSLLNARAGWRRGDRLTVFLVVRNALDRTHLASSAGLLDLARSPATTAIFLPGLPRSFVIGIEWKR